MPTAKLLRYANLVALVAVLCLAVTGCPDGNVPEPVAAPAWRAAVVLRLAVVDDVEMADAIRRWRGEWAARSGGSVEVVDWTAAELIAGGKRNKSGKTDADAIIYPSRYLGLLAEGDRIIPVRSSLLKSDLYDRADIFPLVSERVAVWGDRAMAIPLGSPVLVLYYRADLFERFGLRPPTTWTQYDALVERFASREGLGEAAPPPSEPWYATVEPLAPGWAGRMLLARAAGYAKHRDRFSALFDTETMEPLIAGTAFVRALEALEATFRRAGTPRVDVGEAYATILKGHAAMALAWPQPGAEIDRGQASVELAVAELPGAREVYNAGFTEPVERDAGDLLVPVLGLAGRLGSVTRASKNAPAAFRLLAWLASAEISSQVSTASRATTLFRRSHAESAAVWSSIGTPTGTAQQYAQTVERTLSRTTWLPAPRIPDADEYLAALDEAVAQTLSGDGSAEATLRAAAAKWRTITERRGIDRQREAYRHSLGW